MSHNECYRLRMHGLSSAVAMELVGRYTRTRNADTYRDFKPGTLEFDSYKWAAGFPLEFYFRLKAIDSGEEKTDEEFEREVLPAVVFGDLPDGEWEEIIST